MKASLLSFVLIITIAVGSVACGGQGRPSNEGTLGHQEHDLRNERDIRGDMQRAEMERRREEDKFRQEQYRMEQSRNREEFQDRMREARSEMDRARQDITQREAELRKKTRQIAEQELSSMNENLSELANKLKKLEAQANTLAETVEILVEQSKVIDSGSAN